MNGVAATAASQTSVSQQQALQQPPLAYVSLDPAATGSKAARKKTAKGAMPTWQCALCTFNNKATRDACEMCEMPNPRANDPSPAPVAPVPSNKSQPNGVPASSAAGAAGSKKGSMAASVAAAAAGAAVPSVPAPTTVLQSPSVSATFRAGSYENGLISACNNVTYDEVMRRRLIGLPRPMLDLVSKLRARSSAIFLLNMETREMFGVFEAEGAPGLDLEPDAWAGQQSFNGRRSSRFPAQCHFSIAADFDTPLLERQYRDLLYRGDAGKRDKIRLISAEEVKQLIKLFQSKCKLRKVPQTVQATVAPPPAASSAAAAAAVAPAHAAAPTPSISAVPAAAAAVSATTSRRNSVDSIVSEEGGKKVGGVTTTTTTQGGVTKKVTKAPQTCKRWLADECTFSDEACKFLHVATVCRAFQRGTCPKGKNCPFLHDKVDREHYRHGRSYCQKTAVHTDLLPAGGASGAAPSAAAPASATSAGAAGASAAGKKKDSLDSILSGLGSWKLNSKKMDSGAGSGTAEHAQQQAEEDAAAAAAAAAAQDDLDDAAAVAELDAAQQAADEELLAQQDAADDAQHQHAQLQAQQHSLDLLDQDDLGAGGLGFDPLLSGDGGMSFVAGGPGSASGAQGLFLPDQHPHPHALHHGLAHHGHGHGGHGGFDHPAGAGAGAGVNGGWGVSSQFDSGAFGEHPSQGPPSSQSLLSQGEGLFFGGGGGVGEEEEQFAWFNSFRSHIVAPALQAQHQREQQTQHRIIGPD